MNIAPTNKDLFALQFISDYDGGTVNIDKSGVGWVVDFYAGYSRVNFHGESRSLFNAVEEAIWNWSSAKAEWDDKLKKLNKIEESQL